MARDNPDHTNGIHHAREGVEDTAEAAVGDAQQLPLVMFLKYLSSVTPSAAQRGSSRDNTFAIVHTELGYRHCGHPTVLKSSVERVDGICGGRTGLREGKKGLCGPYYGLIVYLYDVLD